MDLEAYKTIATIIQSSVITIGLLVGGVWALYQFVQLKKIDKSMAELDALRQSLLQRSSLELEINPRQETTPLGEFIVVTLKITNSGNAPEFFSWDEKKFYAVPLEEEDGDVKVSNSAIFGFTDEDMTMEELYLDAGAIHRETVFFEVQNYGLYYIFFSVPCSPLVTQFTNKDKLKLVPNGEEVEDTIWVANSSINIVHNIPNNSSQWTPQSSTTDG